ncbi:MAG: DUF2336 domain-containing protein [Alphaproteobacteria bacterium]
MSSVMGKLFGSNKGAGEIDYQKAKKLAGGDSMRQRRKLAKRTDVQPEILYFLAEDSDAEIRRAIAVNGTTPPQADLILARDSDDDVRCGLAHKIAQLAPQLDSDEQDKMYQMVSEVLEILARDELPKVRRILAEELKDADKVPAAVVETLARDEDAAVAAPILEFSPLLSDELLLKIIAGDPVKGAVGAISRRNGVGAQVADAIVGSDDETAVASLLANSSAQIREETLDSLVERAENVSAWHKPLVRRPSLSQRAMKRLSEFVADSLLEDLAAREDIDKDTARVVGEAVRLRIRKAPAADESDTAGRKISADVTPQQRARDLHDAGKLDEETVLEGLGKGDRAFVSAALSLRAGVAPEIVQKIASMESAKGIIAMSWKAGLSMRTAVQLQLRLIRIAPTKIMNPKNGVDYPLTAEEMNWQLEFFAG